MRRRRSEHLAEARPAPRRDSKNPDAVGAWLATTARRECLPRHRGREVPDPVRRRPSEPLDEHAASTTSCCAASATLCSGRPDAAAPRRRRSCGCSRPTRRRATPRSVRAGHAIGSIGPTRARCSSVCGAAGAALADRLVTAARGRSPAPEPRAPADTAIVSLRAQLQASQRCSSGAGSFGTPCLTDGIVCGELRLRWAEPDRAACG